MLHRAKRDLAALGIAHSTLQLEPAEADGLADGLEAGPSAPQT